MRTLVDRQTRADNRRVKKALQQLPKIKPGFVAPIYAQVGARVRFLREAMDMTQSTLGELVGLGRTTIVNFENGKQACPLHTILQMAYAMRVRPAALFKGLLD